MRTLDIEECAALLKVDRTTALHLAQNGEIPGAKIGRAWVFIEEDILNYLRSKISAQVNERRAMLEENLKPKVKSVVREVKNGRRRILPQLPDLPESFSQVAAS